MRCDIRKMDSEKERQTETGGSQAENYARMQRQSEADRDRDMEGKTKRTETSGLGCIVSHLSQHKGQLERQCTIQKSLSLVGHPDNRKPLLSAAPCVSSAVGLSMLTEVLNAHIRDLRALQTPAINWGLPEKPMVVGGWATVNLRTLAPKGILHGHQRWSL